MACKTQPLNTKAAPPAQQATRVKRCATVQACVRLSRTESGGAVQGHSGLLQRCRGVAAPACGDGVQHSRPSVNAPDLPASSLARCKLKCAPPPPLVPAELLETLEACSRSVLFCDSHQPPPDKPAELFVMAQLLREAAS